MRMFQTRRIHASLVMVGLVLAGCSAEPIETEKTGNRDVKAGLLAEVDGCRIWRLQDGGARPVYFANCSGRAQRMSWAESRPCGKNQACTHTVSTLGED